MKPAALFLIPFLFITGFAAAAEPPAAEVSSEKSGPAPTDGVAIARVETRHEILRDGKALTYKAIVETLPVVNAARETTAEIATISYLAGRRRSRWRDSPRGC